MPLCKALMYSLNDIAPESNKQIAAGIEKFAVSRYNKAVPGFITGTIPDGKRIMMLIKQVSILKTFKCTGADCPANCCRGWKIPIDDDTYSKYITQKGGPGFVLRRSLDKKEELTSFKCGIRLRCPFWGADRLCGLQKRYGTDLMPRVCVEFPRQLSHFGSFCEETLYLACPEAARLFLKQAREKIPFGFEDSAGEPYYEPNTTNSDFDFLNYLLKTRDTLISMLENGCGLNTCLLEYAKAAQGKCLEYGSRGLTTGYGASGLPLPDPLDYKISDGSLFTVDARMMHTLFFKGFYHPSLKRSSPVLYKLCKSYIREFYALTKSNPDAADRKLDLLMESVYDHIPDFDSIMIAYYEYFLLKNFLDIFEDYCFVNHMLLGMAQAQMLRLFVALYCHKHLNGRDMLSAKELSVIIAVYERRAPQIMDALGKIL